MEYEQDVAVEYPIYGQQGNGFTNGRKKMSDFPGKLIPELENQIEDAVLWFFAAEAASDIEARFEILLNLCQTYKALRLYYEGGHGFSTAERRRSVPSQVGEFSGYTKQKSKPAPTRPTSDPNGWIVGKLRRNIVHGNIYAEDGTTIFVPESIIRRHDAHTGDIFRVRPTGQTLPSGFPEYEYELVERNLNPEDEDRTEVVGPLKAEEYRPNQWSLYVEDGDIKVRIYENQVERYNLQVGDIVTVAYRPSAVNKMRGDVWGRVIFQHNTEDEDTPWSRIKPQKSTSYKDDPDPDKTDAKDEEPPLFKEGVNVLVVGGRNTVYYKEAIERLGADFDWFDGFKLDKDQLEAAIARSDVIIMFPTYMSRTVSEMVYDAVRHDKSKELLVCRSENPSGMVRQIKGELLPRAPHLARDENREAPSNEVNESVFQQNERA